MGQAVVVHSTSYTFASDNLPNVYIWLLVIIYECVYMHSLTPIILKKTDNVYLM